MNKLVHHELNENHKCKCFQISSALLLRNQNDPFLNRIETCDKMWILYDNRKCSERWLDAHKASQHFPKPKLHQKKVIVIIWWSSVGLIHHSYIKPGYTITAEKYCREIDEMHQALGRKQPALINVKSPIFPMITLDRMFQ